jgi:hypothetical protein
VERGLGPVGAAEDRGLARDALRAHPLCFRDESGGDVARAEVFGEGVGNLPRDDVVRYPLYQKGRPWVAPPMHSSMGIDRMKLVREAYSAVLRAWAFSSSLAGLMPSTFF